MITHLHSQPFFGDALKSVAVLVCLSSLLISFWLRRTIPFTRSRGLIFWRKHASLIHLFLQFQLLIVVIRWRIQVELSGWRIKWMAGVGKGGGAWPVGFSSFCKLFFLTQSKGGTWAYGPGWGGGGGLQLPSYRRVGYLLWRLSCQNRVKVNWYKNAGILFLESHIYGTWNLHFSLNKCEATANCWFSVSCHSKQIFIKIKTFQ